VCSFILMKMVKAGSLPPHVHDPPISTFQQRKEVRSKHLFSGTYLKSLTHRLYSSMGQKSVTWQNMLQEKLGNEVSRRAAT
jgi:hypothetical protein